jgi:hypothetical protein
MTVADLIEKLKALPLGFVVIVGDQTKETTGGPVAHVEVAEPERLVFLDPDN